MILVPLQRRNLIHVPRVLENGDLHNWNLMMNRPINFIIWNIRGGNNDNFRLNFIELVNYHHPCMVTLLETRIDNHMSLLNPFGFTDIIEIPAEGQSGGMIILWNHTLVNVHGFVRRNQEISATIEAIQTHKSWLFTSVYASTNINNRNFLWDNLINMHNSTKDPWLVGGDFNDVLSSSEKLGGNIINRNRANFVWNCINKYGLIDLGYKGCKYTWTNRRKKTALLWSDLIKFMPIVIG